MMPVSDPARAQEVFGMGPPGGGRSSGPARRAAPPTGGHRGLGLRVGLSHGV
jgi:hypothetical protein